MMGWKQSNAFKHEYKRLKIKLWGRGLAWSRLRDLGSRDPGSNPGDPTKIFSLVLQIFSIYVKLEDADGTISLVVLVVGLIHLLLNNAAS